jgi:plasmid maintenance system antidote protein, XRE family
MEVDKKRLKEVAVPLDKEAKKRMEDRKANRYWRAASSAIAAKVRRQLKVTNTSRVQLAEMLGVTPANITRYLNGTTNFELRTLVEIERALDIEIINRKVIPEEKATLLLVKEVEYTSVTGSFDSQKIGYTKQSKLFSYA